VNRKRAEKSGSHLVDDEALPEKSWRILVRNAMSGNHVVT